MSELFINLSKVIREIDYLGQAVLKDTGDAIAEGIWEEFEQLVQETAQWSGTTAASWNLTMGGVGEGGGVYTQPEPKSEAEALRRGHQHAVSIAVTRNFGRLHNITHDYRTKAIVIENYAPGSERSEVGPLRSVNQPSGALARFEQRVANKLFKPVRDRVI